jgi:hypothetical protein
MITRRLFCATIVMLLAPMSFADILQLKNGARLSGYFEGGSSRFVRFRTESGVQDYDILTVRSVWITGTTSEKNDGPASASDASDDRYAVDPGQESYAFGPEQEHLIRVWFSSQSNRRNLPPGLAKRDSLPPGLERQLQRNGTLPPGLQRRMEPLPLALEEQLQPLSRGVRRVIVGSSVILIEVSTSRILDLLRNVF